MTEENSAKMIVHDARLETFVADGGTAAKLAKGFLDRYEKGIKNLHPAQLDDLGMQCAAISEQFDTLGQRAKELGTAMLASLDDE